jgi:hypothetical protein
MTMHCKNQASAKCSSASVVTTLVLLVGLRCIAGEGKSPLDDYILGPGDQIVIRTLQVKKSPTSSFVSRPMEK